MDYELNPTVLCYDLYTKNQINVDAFYKLFDAQFSYVYVLKVGKRKHNELQNEPSIFNFPQSKKGKFEN